VRFNTRHALDELKQSIHETIASIEASELKVVPNKLFTRRQLQEQKGDILSTYCDSKFFNNLFTFVNTSICRLFNDAFQ
jgi:hypothetical protein